MEQEELRKKIIDLLKRHSKTSAAKKLGVSRMTLHKYIKKLGIQDQVKGYNKESYITFLENKIKEL